MLANDDVDGLGVEVDVWQTVETNKTDRQTDVVLHETNVNIKLIKIPIIIADFRPEGCRLITH